MQPIAADVTRIVVCRVSVCMLVTWMCPAKTGRTDLDAVWRLTHVGPKTIVLDGVKIGRIHSQPRGVTS